MLSKKHLKILCIIFCVLLTASIVSGCATNAGQSSAAKTASSAPSTAQNQPQGSAKPAGNEPVTKLTLPIVSTPITLKCWSDYIPDPALSYSSMSDSPLYKELEKRTGIKIQFIHPAVGQEAEQFNLMVASKDIPDLIEHNWLDYPGGPEKAILDQIVVPLNDLIDKYAPDLKKLYNDPAPANQMVSKMVKTDSGTMYAVPLIYLDDFQLVWHGPQLRKDWMDELKLEAPATIDEWYAVLKAFKTSKNVQAPFSFMPVNLPMSNGFIGAFGIARDFYLDESNQVKFGPIEPGYKGFLTEFRKWYADGLLDPDFATQDAKTFDSKILADKVGGFLGNVGGHMGKYINAMKDKNPNFKLMGVQYPALKKGDQVKFGQRDFPIDSNAGVAITTVNKYPKESMLFLDYGFTDEGHMLYNFGIEGVSYNMVDGYPKYSDLLTKNPDGLTFNQIASVYCRSLGNGPFVCDPRYFEQYLQYPEQVAAVKEWKKTDTKSKYPPATPTPDESAKLATIMNQVNTYVDEMFLKFIMGQESLDKFDDYVTAVKKMGIDDAIKIKQSALDRFNKR